jgi:hypothetical protein
MSYIYGYQKNKILIFGIFLTIFFEMTYMASFRASLFGFAFIIVGCGMIMIIWYEIVRYLKVDPNK